MSNLSKVAEDVKGLAKKFQAILDLGEALDKVGSIEQATRDAETAKDAAYKEAELAKEESLKVKQALEVEKSKVDLAKKQAEEIVEKANAKFIDIIASAKAQADEIVSDAEAKRLDINGKTNDAYNSFAIIQSDIASKQSELKQLEEQISSIKSKLQAFVGA